MFGLYVILRFQIAIMITKLTQVTALIVVFKNIIKTYLFDVKDVPCISLLNITEVRNYYRYVKLYVSLLMRNVVL